jgi:hypothetical protein
VNPGGKVSDIGFEYIDVEKKKADNESNPIANPEFGEKSKKLFRKMLESTIT